ncbi:MAG TPA: hypothetical protein VFA70_10375 [Dehalococcoidia bacterium]|jgi:peptidoglycan/LPS O-acetylase OafA/YrhL|nr:hypothetical protein [Dehalococcoidia bacterium]
MLRLLRGRLHRPALLLLAAWAALLPAMALAAGGPGEGQPFGIDWTPIVFWVIVGGVIVGGFLLGVLIDWGNR